RVLTATRRLETGVPPGVCRSSGSFVRLPTSTTRLMFAAMVVLLLLVGTCVRFVRVSVPGVRDGSRGGRGRRYRRGRRPGRRRRRLGVVARRARARALDVARRQ